MMFAGLKKTVFVLTCFLIAASTNIYTQEVLIKKYTTRDGLSSNRIYDGVQDQSGLILLATERGVISYDGETFNSPDDTAAVSIPIIQIVQDLYGSFWCLPQKASSSMEQRSETSVISLPPIKKNNETDFELKSVCFLNIDSKIVPLVLDKQSRIHIYKNKDWQIFYEPGKEIYINNIVVKNNLVYLLTNQGLYTYSNGLLTESKTINKKLPSKNIINMVFDNSKIESYFLLSDTWLGRVSEEQFTTLRENFKFTTLQEINQISILKIFKQNVIFGNEYSLHIYNTVTNKVNELVFDKVANGEGGTSIFTDFESNIWITTFRGLYKLRFTPFTNISASDGLLYNEVTSIEFMDNNNVALGQEGNLALYNTRTNEIINIPIESGERGLNIFLRIWDLLYDSRNRLWIVEYARGLGYLDGNIIKWLDLNLESEIQSIAEDTNRNLWIGTKEGLFKLTDNYKLEKNDEVGNISIRKVFPGKNGELYLATTYNGLIIINDSDVTVIKSGMRDRDIVYAVCETKKHGIIVGTKAGLYRINQNQLKPFYKNGFALNNSIYQISENNNGDLWFGLSDGLIMWDGEQSVNYTTSDGLSGLEINRDAGAFDADGNYWIGTNGGLSIFNRSFDYQSGVKPKGRINYVESFKGKKYSLNDISFSSDENNLVFDVSAFSFMDENYNKFHVKLFKNSVELIDSFTTDNSKIRFSYLSPGDYAFNLKFENLKGTMSDSNYTANFSISNPFYKTRWFIILAALLIAIITSVIFRYYNQVKYSQKLEEKVRDRTIDLEREILHKERYEKALIESEKRYKGLFENSAFGIYQSTLSGNIIICNNAFLKMFGLSSLSELKQFNIANTFYFDPQEREKFVQTILKERVLVGFEKKYLTLNNESIWVRESARCLELDNNEIIIEGSVENITDNKIAEASIIEAKERAENSNKIKSQFLAQMSHEIRTPVNTILNFTSLIKDISAEETSSEIEEYFNSIQLGSDRLIKTIDSILNLSQLQLGTYDSNKEILDLSEILTGVITEFKPLAKEKGLTLNFNKTPDSVMIFADHYSVLQIFANLVENAIKYTEHGSIKVDLQTDNESSANIIVEDSGIGMNDDFKNKLFEPFTQEESGYTRRFDGNGLGLALVKNYCEINKAGITVESTKGVGSKFTVTFKLINNA